MIATTISNVLLWLEELGVAVWIRESPYGFAFVVAVHILGLTLSVCKEARARPVHPNSFGVARL